MKNNKENRMETLKENGINVANFFDLSLRIPFGATVTINVNGEEMTLGQPSFQPGISSGGDIALVGANGLPAIHGSVTGLTEMASTEDLANDPIVQNIMNAGYVFNPRTDGRFVCAATFKMLNGSTYNTKTRQWEDGWDAYLRNGYPYMYQFDMMLDELHKLAKMERNNDPEFARLSSFFTKQVVYETCKQYIRQLKKFVNKQKVRKCQGVPYVKLNRYGNVFKKDLNKTIYNKLDGTLVNIKNSNDYTSLERNLKAFMNYMCKLPYETPKCSQWKDAFKGKGSYLTLLNIVKFHNVTVQNYETGEILDRDGSVAYIESLIDTYRGEYWRFHELLKATIERNNFDLRESIHSQRAN